jgi:antitoxin YefM
MVTTYTLNTDELTSSFVSLLKDTYPGREVEILVREAEDETAYLLGSEANRERLLQAVEDIKAGKNLVSVSI